MHVEVFSMHAAVHGREHTVWAGEVDLSFSPEQIADYAALRRDPINGELFRFFNRVDEADNDRLDALGYKLPSLSAGDFITWGGNTYKVRGIGFERVTHNTDYISKLFG